MLDARSIVRSRPGVHFSCCGVLLNLVLPYLLQEAFPPERHVYFWGMKVNVGFIGYVVFVLAILCLCLIFTRMFMHGWYASLLLNWDWWVPGVTYGPVRTVFSELSSSWAGPDQSRDLATRSRALRSRWKIQFNSNTISPGSCTEGLLRGGAAKSKLPAETPFTWMLGSLDRRYFSFFWRRKETRWISPVHVIL